MAKIAVIIGSVRSERHGIKVAKWVVSKLEDKGHQVFQNLRIRAIKSSLLIL
jgi:NAD(P)H-dependent FMN reductase